MDSVKEDLKNRSKEIRDFLKLLKFIEDTSVISNDAEKKHKIEPDLKNTLKGMVFLLLYNLTEATMREAITHIHDQMDEKSIEFNWLKETIRKEILASAKLQNIDLLLTNTTQSISTQLARAAFDQKNLFSGNIDHQEVIKKSKIYGFNTNTDYKRTKHGENLRTIRQKRNDLAHGNISFAKTGGYYSTNDLCQFTKEIIAYLDEITSHIADYVATQSYLT